MKGLLLKDFYTMRRNARTLALMLIVYIAIGAFLNNGLMTLGVISVMGVVTTLSLFSYDELAKWDNYAFSLPVSRREIVSARYISGLIVLGIGIAASLVMWGVLALLGSRGQPAEVLAGLGGSVAAALLIISVTFPISFRYGPERARIAMMVFFLLPVALFSLGSRLGISTPKEETVILLLQIAAGVVVLGFLFSWKLSVAIYTKKEL